MAVRAAMLEKWYVAYAVLGATVAGLVPILVPLTIAQRGEPAQIGTVMAAFNGGSLMAPVWSLVADRFRIHGLLLRGGMIALAAGLAAFPELRQPAAWPLLAFAMGTCAAAGATVANLFVVEVHPRAEWDGRIGWLQTFYGGGQMIGLVLAGLLQGRGWPPPLWVAAGVTAIGSVFGFWSPSVPAKRTAPAHAVIRAPRHGEWAMISPQRMYNHLRFETFARVVKLIDARFGLFLFIWVVTTGGSIAVFTLYPVLMQQLFAVSPVVSSTAFAVSAGLGMLFYSLAGTWSKSWGARRVFGTGLALRLLAYGFLLTLALRQGAGAGHGWLALLPFCLTVVAWSLLTVSGTVLAAELCAAGPGPAMGIYNAAFGLAGVGGAALGGWAGGLWGYRWVPLIPVVFIGAGLALLPTLRAPGKAAATNPGGADEPERGASVAG